MRELTHTIRRARFAWIALAGLTLLLPSAGCSGNGNDNDNGNQNLNDNGNGNDNGNDNTNGNDNDNGNTNVNDNGTPDGLILIQENNRLGEFEVGRAQSSDTAEYAFFGEKSGTGIVLTISQIDLVTANTGTSVRYILDDELRPSTILSEDGSAFSMVYGAENDTFLARFIEPGGRSRSWEVSDVDVSPIAPPLPNFENLCAYFARTIAVMEGVLEGCGEDPDRGCDGSIAESADAMANFCLFDTETTTGLPPGLGRGPSLALPLGIFVASSTLEATPGTTLTFAAVAIGGLPPYNFAWLQLEGPETLIFDTTTSGSQTATRVTPTTEGNYRIRARVVDANISLSAFDVSFTIERDPDALVVSTEQTPSETDPFVVDFSATVTGGEPPYTYGWSTIQAPQGASVSFSPAGQASTRALFSATGNYIVQVLVTDDAGRSTNDQPVVRIVDPATSLLASIDFPECGHDGAAGFDLQAELLASDDTVAPGQEISVTVRGNNLGDETAEGVILKLQYDQDYEFVDSTGDFVPAAPEGMIEWAAVDVAAGATTQQIVTLRLPVSVNMERCLVGTDDGRSQTLTVDSTDIELDTNLDNNAFGLTQVVDVDGDDDLPQCDAGCPLPGTDQDTCVLLGSEIFLTAEVMNATCDPVTDANCPGLTYDWTIIEGAASGVLSSDDSETTSLLAQGSGVITVQLRVTDESDDEMSQDQIDVEVEECQDLEVTILTEGSSLQGCDAEGILNEPVLLRSTVSGFVGSLIFDWRVASGAGEFEPCDADPCDTSGAQDVFYTPLQLEDTAVRLTVTDETSGRMATDTVTVCSSEFSLVIAGPQPGCGLAGAEPCVVENNGSGLFNAVTGDDAPASIDYAWTIEGLEDEDSCTFELTDQDMTVILSDCAAQSANMLVSGNGSFVLKVIGQDSDVDDNTASATIEVQGVCDEADEPFASGTATLVNGEQPSSTTCPPWDAEELVSGAAQVAATGDVVTLSCVVDSLLDREIAWERSDTVNVDIDDRSDPDGCDFDQDGVFDGPPQFEAVASGVDLCPLTDTTGLECTLATGACRPLECSGNLDCDDGIDCNGLEVCIGGLCEPREPLCPGQVCIESTGTCQACVADSQCLDGNFCTVDECQAGVCVNDEVDCQDQACDPATGNCVDAECTTELPGDPCEDVSCGDNEICVDGECVPQSQSAELLNTKALVSNADQDGSGIVSLNDTLTYEFVAINSGNEMLTGVTMVDPLPGLSALSCDQDQPATLAPRESLTCSAMYVVTQDDVDAGVIDNTSTAQSDQTDAVEASESVPVPCDDGDPCTNATCNGELCHNAAQACPTTINGCAPSEIIDPDEFTYNTVFEMPEPPSGVLPPLTFECLINNPATRCDQTSNTVSVYFNVDPVVAPTPDTREQDVSRGDDVTVECNVLSGSQPTTYGWRQVAGEDVTLNVSPAGVLTFTAPDSSGVLEFECRGIVRRNGENLLVGGFNDNLPAEITVSN